jgi:hypothetical protein
MSDTNYAMQRLREIEIQKSMQIGNNYGNEWGQRTPGDYGPVKVQELDRLITEISPRLSGVKLFNAIPRRTYPSLGSNILEAARETGIGREGGSFVGENERAQSRTTTYDRLSQKIALMGGERGVSEVATKIITGDRVGKEKKQREINNEIKRLLIDANISLVSADTDVNPLEFDGLAKQHYKWGRKYDNFATWTFHDYMNDEIVIDNKGKVLSEPVLNKASQVIVENFHDGATDMFMSPDTLTNFAQTYRSNFVTPDGQSVNSGHAISRHMSNWGTVNIHTDIYFKQKKYLSTPYTATATVTAALTAGVAGTAEVAGTNSKFTSADVGKFFAYCLTPIYTKATNGIVGDANPKEAGAIFVSAPAYAVGAGAGNATITVSIPWSVINTPDYANAAGFNVWRTKDLSAAPGAASFQDFYRIGRVKKSVGGVATVFEDRNYVLPGTDEVLIWENGADNLHIAQTQGGMMLFEFGNVDLSDRFQVWWGLTPMFLRPRSMVRIINVGSDTSTTNLPPHFGGE